MNPYHAKHMKNANSVDPDQTLRKPLSVQNGSRLPAPSSRLKPPTITAKNVAGNAAGKRSASPVESAPGAASKLRGPTRTGIGLVKPSRSLDSAPVCAVKPVSGSSRPGAVKRARSPQEDVTAKRRKVVPTSTVARPVIKPATKKAVSSKPAGRVRPAGQASNVGSRQAAAVQESGAAASGGGGGKKRPPWDLKGRLQDMEEQMKLKTQERADFMSQMSEWNGRINQLENKNSQLSGTVAQKEEHATIAMKENDELRQNLRVTEEELQSLKRQFERDTENFEFTKASLRRQKESLEGEITALQQEVTGLKSSVSQLTSSQAGLKAELDTTKILLENSLKYGKDRDAEIVGHLEVIQARDAEIQDYNSKFREHETVRRKLHNTIQELKGNIRVFCRVRPLIGEELSGIDADIPYINFSDDDPKTLELERLADISLSESTLGGGKRNGNGRHAFTFDQVFQPTSTQGEVFEEISQLVQSALDGYNVCIFAYGQTGSGKTYTMEGPSVVDREAQGMIPRAVCQIFTCTHQLEENGWQYQFEASFLEIYNETIRDLLGNHGPDVKHEVKMTGTGAGSDVTVTNLTYIPVNTEHQITELLKTASKNRAVGKTQCNERSSRSHSVFRLKITGANDITSEQCKGTLNLVDLAGSERLKESGATGQRLKETQNINKSLSHLGNVIMALGNKEAHVPYRNSKLTYLLQNSLGGNSKTLMFVNVSPREENFSETLNSLRFATKVNQCNIGTATKKTR